MDAQGRDHWKDLMLSAYRKDPCSRRVIEDYNAHWARILDAGLPPAEDPAIAVLHRRVWMAVHAHAGGNPFPEDYFGDCLH